MMMTPQEVRAEFRAIEKEIGPKAEIFVHLNIRAYERFNFAARVYVDGLTGHGAEFHVETNDLGSLPAEVHREWGARQAAHAAEQTRKLALAIIRLTHDLGECTDAAVRADGFSDTDLERYGADAIERANAMAERGPFTIRKMRGGNGAPAEEEAARTSIPPPLAAGVGDGG